MAKALKITLVKSVIGATPKAEEDSRSSWPQEATSFG